jgi:hypothetical protein
MDTHPTQHEASNDPAGRSDDHHDADPHPHRDGGTAPSAGGEQHEGIVIARLGVSRNARPQGE